MSAINPNVMALRSELNERLAEIQQALQNLDLIEKALRKPRSHADPATWQKLPTNSELDKFPPASGVKYKIKDPKAFRESRHNGGPKKAVNIRPKTADSLTQKLRDIGENMLAGAWHNIWTWETVVTERWPEFKGKNFGQKLWYLELRGEFEVKGKGEMRLYRCIPKHRRRKRERFNAKKPKA